MFHDNASKAQQTKAAIYQVCKKTIFVIEMKTVLIKYFFSFRDNNGFEEIVVFTSIGRHQRENERVRECVRERERERDRETESE